MRINSRRTTAALMLGGLAVAIAGCASLPNINADERWANYKDWTKITENKVSTGATSPYLGNVHAGPTGYRDVYVNDAGAAMLASEGPYNFPTGTVIVKEQFANKADWEAGLGAEVTVSLKVGDMSKDGKSVKENWIWADSFKATAKPVQYCSGCHGIAAKDDFVFTNGAFLANH